MYLFGLLCSEARFFGGRYEGFGLCSACGFLRVFMGSEFRVSVGV